MSNQVVVIDSMNSGIAVGTKFASRRDLNRTLPRGEGMKVGFEQKGRKLQLRRAPSTTWIEDYGRVLGAPRQPSTDLPSAPAARGGRKSYKVLAPMTSGLQVGAVFHAERTMVRQMGAHTSVRVLNLNDNREYNISVAGSTYRVQAV